jgi:hypothetical protein
MESDMKNREGEEEGMRMKIDFMLSRMEHSKGKTTRGHENTGMREG